MLIMPTMSVFGLFVLFTAVVSRSFSGISENSEFN